MKQSSRKSLPSIIAASTAGTLIEWYDFFLFGSLAIILSTHFFPKENPTASFLATLATFSAGLIVRPLGALIFGRLGDAIGRKYTFMITLSIMGVCTIGMGLVPGYASIGFLAPLIVLLLRLLQGLALGGEYGGAAIYIAEHAPEQKRGLMTSWIQSTSGVAFVLSVTIILFIKSLMPEKSWLQWGWRLPFIASLPLIGVSIYIRNKMSESPLFAEARSEGKISKNPIRESFGHKANLKVVLLAFFGLTLGGGTIGWITFYAQSFFLKTLMLDYDQASTIIIIGILTGVPFFFLFGWLSDKIGRKHIMMFGMLIGVFSFRPIFQTMYKIVQPEHNKVILKNIVSSTFTIQQDGLDSLQVITTEKIFQNGSKETEIKKINITNSNAQPVISKSIRVSDSAQWKLILMIFLLQFIFTMAYGPLGAYMVELFPLKIRYTSISFPYHFGFGIFGGLAPYFASYLTDKALTTGKPEFYLAGLNYPIILTAISILVGVIYLTENDNRFSVKPIGDHFLNIIRKWLGLLWIVLGIMVIWFGIIEVGIPRLLSGRQEDVVFGAILTFIITPSISLGFLVFGKYALNGEYRKG